jgi:hypothetical protein
MRMPRTVAALLAAIVLVNPGRAGAQAVHRPARVAVTVALDSALSAGTPFRLIRRSEVEPFDVIVLRTDAGSAELTEAVRQLLLIRQVQGDTATETAVVRVRPAPTNGSPPVLPWAARVLTDLRHAPSRAIAGVGTLPSLVIWLPPQRAARPPAN